MLVLLCCKCVLEIIVVDVQPGIHSLECMGVRTHSKVWVKYGPGFWLWVCSPEVHRPPMLRQGQRKYSLAHSLSHSTNRRKPSSASFLLNVQVFQVFSLHLCTTNFTSLVHCTSSGKLAGHQQFSLSSSFELLDSNRDNQKRDYKNGSIPNLDFLSSCFRIWV